MPRPVSSPPPAHYSASIGELRALVRSADLEPTLAFINRVRSFVNLIDKSETDERSEILLPNDATSDIVLFEEILDTEASDIYFDHEHDTARSAVFPRLRMILILHDNMTARRIHFLPHRRRAVTHSKKLLAKHIHRAKNLLRRIARDVFEWQNLHLTKERWRRALLHRAPALKRYILHFDPPKEFVICNLQSEILEGCQLKLVSHAYMSHTILIEHNSWRHALLQHIPELIDFILFFDPPDDELWRDVQTDMMLKTLTPA